MSRKHNTQHPDRGRSHYPDRLAARGLTKAPTMPDLDRLRGRQTSADWLDAHPWIKANLEA
jgi:hypothetical protein